MGVSGRGLTHRFIIQEDAGIVRRRNVATRVADRCVAVRRNRAMKADARIGIIIGGAADDISACLNPITVVSRSGAIYD